MLSVAPNIVFAPNMMQNAERKHRTQNTNTAHFRTPLNMCIHGSEGVTECQSKKVTYIDLGV